MSRPAFHRQDSVNLDDATYNPTFYDDKEAKAHAAKVRAQRLEDEEPSLVERGFGDTTTGVGAGAGAGAGAGDVSATGASTARPASPVASHRPLGASSPLDFEAGRDGSAAGDSTGEAAVAADAPSTPHVGPSFARAGVARTPGGTVFMASQSKRGSSGFTATLQRYSDLVHGLGLGMVALAAVLAACLGAILARLTETHSMLHVLLGLYCTTTIYSTLHVALRRHSPLRVRGAVLPLLARATLSACTLIGYVFALVHIQSLAGCACMMLVHPMLEALLDTAMGKQPAQLIAEAVAAGIVVVGVVATLQPSFLGEGATGSFGKRAVGVVVGLVAAAAQAGTSFVTVRLGYTGVEAAVVVFWDSLFGVALMPVLVLTAGASVFHGDQAEEPTEGPIGMAFIVVLLVAGFVAFAASFLLTQSQQTQRQGPVRMLQFLQAPCAWLLQWVVLGAAWQWTSVQAIGGVALVAAALAVVTLRHRRSRQGGHYERVGASQQPRTR